jgi:hypothetical protein
MKRTTYTLAGMILAAAVCAAQSGSLGDYARAARKESKPAATKVFDNDNIPKDSHLSVVGTTPDAQATDGNAANAGSVPKDGAPAANSQAANAAKADDIKMRLNEQKGKLELASRELDVTQREYRLRAASFYADAGDRLRNSAAWDKEDADYKKRIADQQKAVDDGKKQVEELQEQLRKAGGK